MEFEIGTPRYSFSSCVSERNTSYPATEQAQHDWRKLVIKDQEPQLYLSLLKSYWVILTSCSYVTPLVQMHNCPRARTQSISEMHHGVCGMWLLSWQSPHTFPEQMCICTCLPSLFVPITASKDLALGKRLPVCCAACVLVQLPVSAVAEGHWPLPCTWPDGLGVQRRGVSLQRHGQCHVGMGFTMIRSLTLIVTYHSYQQTLWYCLLSYTAPFSHRWGTFFLRNLTWFLQTGVIQDEHVQPVQHKSWDAPCLTGCLILQEGESN